MTLHPRQTGKGKWRFKALLCAAVLGAGSVVLTFVAQSAIATRNNGIFPVAITESGAFFQPGTNRIKARAVQPDDPVAAMTFASPQGLSYPLLFPPAILDPDDNSSPLGYPEIEESPKPEFSESELKLLGAQVGREATRRLQRLSQKYNLSKEQQALVFPVIARASPAYGQLSSLAGETLADAYVVQPVSFPLPEALDASEASGSGDLTQNGQTDSGTTSESDATASEAMATSGVDDFEEALHLSLEALESQLAPFLNSEQLALMDEEQVDRFYWWGEILLQLNGDNEADAQSVSGALESATASSVEPTAGAGFDAVSAAHQGGNLLDLLSSQAGTPP